VAKAFQVEMLPDLVVRAEWIEVVEAVAVLRTRVV